MTANHSKRPALATAICIYEILLFLFPFGIVAFIIITALRLNISAHLPILNLMFWFNCVLVLAAVVTLWQMRPIAVYFFAVKLLASCWGTINLFLFLHKFGTRHLPMLPGTAIQPATMFAVAPAIRIVQIILGAAIVCYVYMITRNVKTSPFSSV